MRSPSRIDPDLPIPRPGLLVFRLACLTAFVLILPLAWAVADDRAPAPVPAPVAVTNAADLRARLAAHLDRPIFASADWGVKVVSLDTGATLFERNATRPMIPASNTKLFTAALVLDRLGTDLRIRTSVFSHTKPDAKGRIAGDLVLYGRGDPSISSRYPYGDVQASLGRLVDSLARAGVRAVRGDVIADESYFQGAPVGSGWAVEDLDSYYSPEVSALSLQDNVADWVLMPGAAEGSLGTVFFPAPLSRLVAQSQARTVARGSAPAIQSERLLGQNVLRVWGTMPLGAVPMTNAVTVHRPAEWFGDLFRSAALQRGIRIDGRVHAVDAFDRLSAPLKTNEWVEVGAIESPPMAELVQAMMKPSNNLYAQLLFLQVGAVVPAEGGTTEARAADVMRRFLKRVLAGHPEPHLEEGSGLSRVHAVSADAVVALLTHMDHHAASSVYKESMPVAGVDGTLRGRMRHTAAENNLRGKTGTLRGVNTLSGYLRTAAGERLAFSILLNQYVSPDAKRPARDEVDALAVMIAEFQGVSR